MLKLPFELSLALRYLRPKRTFVSVITLISIIGVMLGVAVLIVVISVMTGFDRQLREKILGFNPHLKVLQDGPMSDYALVASAVSSNRHVKGAAPFVMGQVMVQNQPNNGNPVYLCPVVRGVDPDPSIEAQVSVLPSSVKFGTFDVTGNRVLVGQDLALKMNLKVGDTIAIYSVADFKRVGKLLKRARDKEALDEGFLPTDFEISGIFDVGYYEFNNYFVVCSLANAQDLCDLDDSVQGLMVTLHDPGLAQQVRAELRPVLGPDYRIVTWEEENAEILDALLVEKNMMFYLLFFISIVAAFGIMSNLIAFVVQKTREIGILKALGASRRQITSIFFSQSLLVGLIGITAGLWLGMFAVWYRNEFLRFLRRASGIDLFPARIYSFSELPALIDPGDVALICGGALFMCLLAGALPALYAGWLKPVEALRYE
ncbi:MAG: FtsX-like permease family protein [Verrucomicrobia bacterium]|nr:FtsX-like permease family protein [Verrucomicrobiota bacterium]